MVQLGERKQGDCLYHSWIQGCCSCSISTEFSVPDVANASLSIPQPNAQGTISDSLDFFPPAFLFLIYLELKCFGSWPRQNICTVFWSKHRLHQGSCSVDRMIQAWNILDFHCKGIYLVFISLTVSFICTQNYELVHFLESGDFSEA